MINVKSLLNTLYYKWNTYVFYIPCKRENTEDSVIIIKNIISLKLRIKSFTLEKYEKSLGRIIKQENISEIKKLILFAHPNNAKSSFLVSSNRIHEDKSLLPDWWQNEKTKEIKIVFANVCFGATILKRKMWSTIFPNWISYKNHLTLYVGSSKSRTIWREVYNKIIDKIIEMNDVLAIKHMFYSIYNEKIANIYENYDPQKGDSLTMMYLVKSKKLLTTSES